MHSVKAQFAVEHILVVLVAILVMIPIINMIYSYSSSQTREMVLAQIRQTGNKIVDNAETIFYMGPPGKMTIDENFPEGISDIVVSPGNKEMVFFIDNGRTEIPFLSEVPLYGPYYLDATTECKDVQEKACYTQGLKHIVLQAATGTGNQNIVLIIFK